MKNKLIETITSRDDAIRNRPAEELLQGLSPRELLRLSEELEVFRRSTPNLYHRVRAGLLIFAAYRFYLEDAAAIPAWGPFPLSGAARMASGSWESAIQIFRPFLRREASAILISVLAEAYYRLAFEDLLSQVKRSLSHSRGNEWMFQPLALREYPLRVRDSYRQRDPHSDLYPLGFDSCPVRVDPCHAGWSDIFFLAMDFPAGARVVNLSVDINLRGRGKPRPPIECFSRVIDEPVIRLVSLDLGCQKEISQLTELFNFEADHLKLLKAGIIASGIVPPVFEKMHLPLTGILRQLLGKGRGLELITRVRNLPPGSRLAVSTVLLNTIITRLMRMTGQLPSTEGGLSNAERSLVVARTILGEWLGGSGGGWQDSGGLWPGIKVIGGVEAKPGDTEFGKSRGKLLPSYQVLRKEELPEDIEEKLRRSMVLIHGGLSQDIGSVLEMVTEKYLLRYQKEWRARMREMSYFDRIVGALKQGDMKRLGQLTTADWERGTKEIIPRASNTYTEDLIRRMNQNWGKRCWGFLMLGGAAGGGMAFIVDPKIHEPFARDVLKVMKELKRRYQRALPFAMEPVVFDFALNQRGIQGCLFRGKEARPPEDYYRLRSALASGRLVTAMKKIKKRGGNGVKTISGPDLKKKYGFDRSLHRRHKKLLHSGLIGVAQNRLPRGTRIGDVRPDDIHLLPSPAQADFRALLKKGRRALREGEAAVVTFSGGRGSRWTEGAGVVKALHPFVFLKGKHRSFLEVHLAKSQKVVQFFGHPLQHVFTTSFLTHQPIASALRRSGRFGYSGRIYLSRGLSLAQRLYPTERDLRAVGERELKQVRHDSLRKLKTARLSALIRWVREKGEGKDYRDNIPLQRFYPPGHWYEIPNLIRNGVLGKMLRDNSNLRYLLVHNLDTVGTTLDPALLGLHISLGRIISFEVTPRRWGDQGGFLARVNGRVRLVESLALPRDEDTFKLRYYNSLTSWISIDGFLEYLGLTREEIIPAKRDEKLSRRIDRALREIEKEIPTYVTIKEVQLIWGKGQVDAFPFIQCEKLWGDMTGREDLEVSYLVVGRQRAQQLKDPDLLDHWMRDGSLEQLERLTEL